MSIRQSNKSVIFFQRDSRLGQNDKIMPSILSFGFLFPSLDDIDKLKLKHGKGIADISENII